MDYKASGNKLYEVIESTMRKRNRKKELDESKSVVTVGSESNCQVNKTREASGKRSLQDLPCPTKDGAPEEDTNRKRDSCTSIHISSSKSPRKERRSSRSPVPNHRHRRSTREGNSLAINAGLASTPRSATPLEPDEFNETIPRDQDSIIYAFLEDAIKREKKNHRHSHRREERREQREREISLPREHRHRHRRHHEPRQRDKDEREQSNSPSPQNVLLETFAKLCAQMSENAQAPKTVTRTHSHKSLQCDKEVATSHNNFSEERHHVNVVKQRSFDKLRDVEKPSRADIYQKPSRDKVSNDWLTYDRASKAPSKLSVLRSPDDRFREYPENIPARYVSQRDRPPYRDYERPHRYDDDRRRQICEQKTSRSFEVRREYDEDRCKSTRSDGRRYDGKYYERGRESDRAMVQKECARRHLIERCDRNSVVSRDEFRERDKYSERERDSGLSVADGETSTISGRSNTLRVVKQEISEQREAMDKMMKLWKELMRCFKGISQPQDKDKPTNDRNVKVAQESTEHMRESAAAQLRLWRECMRRYETVARDVGDTDARLMEEINKQRSEMAEMATMWQECLQRYRDMSNDFNTLKKKLAAPAESPTRLPAAPPPLLCAEGEGTLPAPQYRIPPNYSHIPPPPNPAYPCGVALRGRASAPPGPPGPPAWWWGGAESPRRRSSPDSRGSRDRERDRDRDRERDRRHKDVRDERYKGKSSKPNAARSEHRHRKR